MEKNEFQNKIQLLANILFDNLSLINGRNFHTSDYIKKHNEYVTPLLEGIPFCHFSTRLFIKNLKDIELFYTDNISIGKPYGVSIDNDKHLIDSNLKFYFALSLSHSYELFEIFIKNILRVIEKYDPNIIQNSFDRISYNTDSGKNIDSIISTNNKEFFKLFRSIFPDLERIEKNNPAKLDLIQWYQIFSKFRHSVTHSDLQIENNVIKDLNKNIIKTYFRVIKHCKNPNCQIFRFDIDYNILVTNLEIIGSYAYLILSEIEMKYEFKISTKN